MRKIPNPSEKRLRLAGPKPGESNRFAFLQLDALAPRLDANDALLMPRAAVLSPHPMRSRTPGLAATPQFPVTARPNLAEFFSRRNAAASTGDARYDADYQPASIAARFLRYPLEETTLRRNA